MNQQVIIFEGHDRSGKSTIAKALGEELGIPIYKAQRDKHWWDPMVNISYFTEGITQFIEQTGISVILDRWMPSDYMYSKLFDRDISYRKIFELDERFAKMNAKLIICYKDPDKYIVDTEDFEFVKPEMYTEMTRLYHEYAEQSKIKNIIFLNTSSQILEKQLAIIKAKLCI